MSPPDDSMHCAANRATVSRSTSRSHRPELLELADRFGADLADWGSFEPVGDGEMPAGYRTLLAHTGHMTVTLEAFHQTPVNVVVVREQILPTSYTRQSQLVRSSDHAVVQCGIMRIDLVGLPDQVRHEIQTHAAPLGRVLIRHNLLREVELYAVWRITVGAELAWMLAKPVGETVYGRSAAIHLSGEPAVDLLEIVAATPTVPI